MSVSHSTNLMYHDGDIVEVAVRTHTSRSNGDVFHVISFADDLIEMFVNDSQLLAIANVISQKANAIIEERALAEFDSARDLEGADA